jgi:hypothetical protein
VFAAAAATTAYSKDHAQDQRDHHNPENQKDSSNHTRLLEESMSKIRNWNKATRFAMTDDGRCTTVSLPPPNVLVGWATICVVVATEPLAFVEVLVSVMSGGAVTAAFPLADSVRVTGEGVASVETG